MSEIQAEIQQLEFDQIFILKSADDKQFMVAGYASVPIIDAEKERIRPSALDSAFKLLMKRVSRRNYNLHHSNIQIGELHWNYRDKDGNIWKAGLDYDGKLNSEKALAAYGQKAKPGGLFVLCEVFNDTDSGRETISQMKKGNLLSFSIGGKVLPDGRETKCDDSRCWSDVVKLELNEVTSCNEGINREAEAFILKGVCANDENSEAPYLILYKDNPENYIPANKNMVGEGKKMEDDITDEKTFGERLDKLEKAQNAKPKMVTKYFFGKPQRENFEKEEDFYAELGVYTAHMDALDKAIDDEVEKVTDETVDKESYRACMSREMKGGKDMKEAAKVCKVEAKKAKKKPEDEEDEEDRNKAAKKPEEYYYYKKPEKKEDFKDEAAYNKAVADYEALRKAIEEELTGSGQVIKKSLDTTKKTDAKVDLAKMVTDADGSRSIKDFLRK